MSETTERIRQTIKETKDKIKVLEKSRKDISDVSLLKSLNKEINDLQIIVNDLKLDLDYSKSVDREFGSCQVKDKE